MADILLPSQLRDSSSDKQATAHFELNQADPHFSFNARRMSKEQEAWELKKNKLLETFEALSKKEKKAFLDELQEAQNQIYGLRY